MLWPRDKSGKNRVLKSRTLNVFQNNLYFTIFTFLSLQFKFSVHSCILRCLIAFLSHPFAYFLTSGYLLQTPDNSNFFWFPLRVRIIGSRLYILSPYRAFWEEWTCPIFQRERNYLKNPNWQEANKLALYKRGRGFELGTTEDKSPYRPGRDLNSQPPDYRSSALTARPRCLLQKHRMNNTIPSLRVHNVHRRYYCQMCSFWPFHVLSCSDHILNRKGRHPSRSPARTHISYSW